VFLVPFSSVTTIKNMSKEFAFAKIDLRVAYGNDVDTIIAIMREIAEEMRADEKFRHAILSDLEVWGVDKFDDTAVTVVTRLKTMPNQQWSVTREFNRRLKRVFDERGVGFPVPQRIVHFIPEKSVQVTTERPDGEGGQETMDAGPRQSAKRGAE
jgi:small conductance mechanosensitive channel